jgi:hypothetical protein
VQRRGWNTLRTDCCESQKRKMMCRARGMSLASGFFWTTLWCLADLSISCEAGKETITVELRSSRGRCCCRRSGCASSSSSDESLSSSSSPTSSSSSSSTESHLRF